MTRKKVAASKAAAGSSKVPAKSARKSTAQPAASAKPSTAGAAPKSRGAASRPKGAKLASKACVPCEGGVPKLNSKQIAKLLPQLDGWTVDGETIRKTRTFFDFLDAMDFCNAMADIAEEEGHHPDFCVHFNRVDITIWTHAIGGLSENDFILAAKLDGLD